MKSAENKIFEIDGASFNPESGKDNLSWRENFSMLKDVSHISSCIEGLAFIRGGFEKNKEYCEWFDIYHAAILVESIEYLAEYQKLLLSNLCDYVDGVQ